MNELTPGDLLLPVRTGTDDEFLTDSDNIDDPKSIQRAFPSDGKHDESLIVLADG